MQPEQTPLKTRLAPSPTGHLHLGHVLHLLYLQGLAKQLGASIDLRMEDHDLSRCRPEFEVSILSDLKWLGVDIPSKLWRQSDRFSVYEGHLQKLINQGIVYACRCSRREIQVATGQVAGELRYPGTCRNKNHPFDAPDSSIRLKMTERSPNPPGGSRQSDTFAYNDLFLGRLSGEPSQDFGDVVIRDRNRQWTYQFAVVVDDLEQGINLIIRGRDLLSSTARQLAMREIISPGSQSPIYAHHPLLTDTDGQKLAKRNSSEAIANLRHDGFTAAEVRGLAAFMGGLTKTPSPLHNLDGLDFNCRTFTP